MEKGKIPVNLNENEKKILDNVLQLEVLSSIRPYITSILLDGVIIDEDVAKIDDFIIDWMVENEGVEVPGPLRFIQTVILGRINGDYVAPPTQVSGGPLVPSNSPPMAQMEPIIDMEDLPSYLPKIYDLIEREVRRRVKEEMKEYNSLLKRYEELKKKFEGISQLFKIE